MKNKKKSAVNKSANTVKMVSVKTVDQREKLDLPTKDKTFASIEETTRTLENESLSKRESHRHQKNARKSCLERMQERQLSPFSQESLSVSPKKQEDPWSLIRRQKQEMMLKAKEDRKTVKQRVSSARYDRKTGDSFKGGIIDVKKKCVGIQKKASQLQAKQREKKVRVDFQNQFLRMMNDKRTKNEVELPFSKFQRPFSKEPSVEGSSKRNTIEPLIIAKTDLKTQLFREHDEHRNKKVLETLKLKVVRSVFREYSNLSFSEKKVMFAIVFVQRLWRQRKIKQFFTRYVTPGASPVNSLANPHQSSFEKHSVKNKFSAPSAENKSTMNLLSRQLSKVDYQENQGSLKLIKSIKSEEDASKGLSQKNVKYGLFNKTPFKTENSQESQIEQVNTAQMPSQKPTADQKSCQIVSKPKGSDNREQILIENQSDFDFKEEASGAQDESQNLCRASMIRFVEQYREVKLARALTKHRKKNFFGLASSLSEKCLMQKYYSRVFGEKPSQTAPKNYELFDNVRSQKRAKDSIELFEETQKSIELKRQIEAEKGEPAVANGAEEEVWVRNETCYEDEEIPSQQIESGERLLTGDTVPDEKQSSCNAESADSGRGLRKTLDPSLKSISQVAEMVIEQLHQEFSREFLQFQARSCLTKKKKKSRETEKAKSRRYPGVEITSSSISFFLATLIETVLQSSRARVAESMKIFDSTAYIKIHRVYCSPIYDAFEFEDCEDEDFNWNIVGVEAFSSSIQAYEQKHLPIPKEHEKFRNSLELYSRAHVHSLNDSFSEELFNRMLRKKVHPWQSSKAVHSGAHSLKPGNDMCIRAEMQDLRTQIVKQCFTRVGQVGSKRLENREMNIRPIEEVLESLVNCESEEAQILKMIRGEFVEQKDDPIHKDELFQIKMALSEMVFDSLIQEVEDDKLLGHFGDQECDEKMESVMETNATLENTFPVD